jgi:hypothetical protein
MFNLCKVYSSYRTEGSIDRAASREEASTMAMHMAFLYANGLAKDRREWIANDVCRSRSGKRRPGRTIRNPATDRPHVPS